jgi:hypothetical protein
MIYFETVSWHGSGETAENQEKIHLGFLSGCKQDTLIHIIVVEAVAFWKQNLIVLQCSEITTNSMRHNYSLAADGRSACQAILHVL